MLHLVSKSARTQSFSPRVCGALNAMRTAQLAEEDKLDHGERLELAAALEVLAMALLLESGMRAHGIRE